MVAIATMAATNQATTIALSRSTKERLRRLAEKGETYDQVVLRLIHRAALKERDGRWNRILQEEELVPLTEIE